MFVIVVCYVVLLLVVHSAAAETENQQGVCVNNITVQLACCSLFLIYMLIL